MGLLVALPGYALAYLVKARRDEYEAFLARLESFTLLTYDGPGTPPESGAASEESAPVRSDVDLGDEFLSPPMPA